MRLAFALITASIIIGTPASSSPSPDLTRLQKPSDETKRVFRSGIEVIIVSVTATDRSGRPVTDLRQGDFVILEDGIEQEIVSFRSMQDSAREPIGLGLVLDISGSMGPQPSGPFGRIGSESRLGTMKIAIERLIKERLGRDDDVYVLPFDSASELVQPWTTDHASVVNTVRRLSVRRNNRALFETALYDAIGAALHVSASGRHRKQVVLVITDGNDNRSAMSRVEVAAAARASGVLVYALLAEGEEQVRLREPANEETVAQLSQITDSTGGFASKAAGFQQLEDAILKISREFTQQYELGYARRQVSAGYHEVVVDVRRAGVTTRHRRGYLAN